MTAKRFIEILPGALTWSALIVPIILAFLAPAVVVLFIILFDIYWLFKTLIMAWHLIRGYKNLKQSLATNWTQHIKELKNDPRLYHVVIFAIYKESFEIIDASVESVLASNYPNNRLMVVVATEQRSGEHAKMLQKKLQTKYKNKFFYFLTTEHPDIPGEMKGKGSNVTWAAKQLVQWVKKKKIPLSHVVVSTADADSRFHPEYFSYLTIAITQTPDGFKQSYQPIPLFTNNIWYAPAVPRILAFGSTFWQLIEATRPWRLITFATHAMTLQTLVDINFWDVTIVNEDSRQFWRAYFHYHGKHHAVPIFLPVYMDAVHAGHFWKTMNEQYKQRLRWAYGVEHAPYIVTGCIKHTEIPLGDRLIKLFRFFEANYSWATASIYIAIVGWLPILLNREFSQTTLSFNFPLFTSRILTATWIGLIISAILSLQMLPPKPKNAKTLTAITMVGQWVLIPIASIFFGSLPAIDAQTRLMLGKYMGFHVTEKKAVTSSS